MGAVHRNAHDRRHASTSGGSIITMSTLDFRNYEDRMKQ
jgi:hypothetical protein